MFTLSSENLTLNEYSIRSVYERVRQSDKPFLLRTFFEMIVGTTFRFRSKNPICEGPKIIKKYLTT